MFSKLLKHEWKDNSKLLWILTICVVGIALLATVLLRVAFPAMTEVEDSDFAVFFVLPVMMLFFLAYLSILAYGMAVHYVLLFRFYKSRFTDRGYLMFTLPVKTHCHFTVPAVHMLIWQVISGVITVACVGLLFFVGFDWYTITGSENFFQEFFYMFQFVFGDAFGSSYLATIAVTAIVQCVSSIVIPMACIVAACAIAKKHKVLVSIGLIYGVSTIMGIISYIITMIPMFMIMSADNSADSFLILTQVMSWIMPIALTVTGYILSVKLMKNKLNLP